MFDTYSDIFNQRGAAYDHAMRTVPTARAEEFKVALGTLFLRPGMTLLDIPAGGGYLRDYCSGADLTIVSVECSGSFAALGTQAGCQMLYGALDAIPLPDASMDAVLSVAGLHHCPNRDAFYREARRVLRPQERLSVLDVEAGSGVDRFLNGVVNRLCSMGHRGDFFTDREADRLRGVGFIVERVETAPMTWRFASVSEMATFCRCLFGLDRATPSEIVEGIAETIGFEEGVDGVALNWSLMSIVARRDD